MTDQSNQKGNSEQEFQLIAQGCLAEADDDLKHAQTSAAIMASIIAEESDVE